MNDKNSKSNRFDNFLLKYELWIFEINYETKSQTITDREIYRKKKMKMVNSVVSTKMNWTPTVQHYIQKASAYNMIFCFKIHCSRVNGCMSKCSVFKTVPHFHFIRTRKTLVRGNINRRLQPFIGLQSDAVLLSRLYMDTTTSWCHPHSITETSDEIIRQSNWNIAGTGVALKLNSVS